MGTHNDAIQSAIFTTSTVVSALAHMAFDAAIFFGRTVHNGRLLSRNRENRFLIIITTILRFQYASHPLKYP